MTARRRAALPGIAVAPAVALALAVAVSLPGNTPALAQAAAKPTDRAYCDLLVETYNRYLGQTINRSQFPDAAAANAIADCERGNTAAGIAVLERKLRNAGFAVPNR